MVDEVVFAKKDNFSEPKGLLLEACLSFLIWKMDPLKMYFLLKIGTV